MGGLLLTHRNGDVPDPRQLPGVRSPVAVGRCDRWRVLPGHGDRPGPGDGLLHEPPQAQTAHQEKTR